MVCVETLLVRGDLVRTLQQAFPGAKRGLSAIYVSLQKVKTSQETKNMIQYEHIIHRLNTPRCVKACKHAIVCYFEYVYREQSNSLWPSMKKVLLISHKSLVSFKKIS